MTPTRQALVIGLLTLTVAAAFPASPAAARTIQGTPRADVLSGSRSADVIRGRGGDDRISGGPGADRVFGDAGDDRMAGGLGKDRLEGGSGRDRLSGGAGANLLSGGPGNDTLSCGSARDTALVDARDVIGTDCEQVLDARSRQPLVPASQIPDAQAPGSAPPPGKVCHLETKTVLVLEGVGSQAHYVLKPQVVVICVDGSTQPGGGTPTPPAPQCSDGRDNDGDLAIDFPADRGCDSAADTAEYPDRISDVEQLLAAREGFWWQQADVTQFTGVCNLYRFHITPQGDRVGTRQAYFLNPISRVCQTWIPAPNSAFTWAVSDFAGPPVDPPFTPFGAQVRIQLVSGTIFQLWIFARAADHDVLGFTTGAPPGQAGAVLDLLWGCTSQGFPPVFRTSGCTG